MTLLTLALLPLLLATAVLLSKSSKSLRLKAKEYSLATADNALRAISQLTESSQRELQAIGAVLAQSALSESDRTRLARSALAGSQHVHQFALYSTDGKNVLNMRARVVDALQPPKSLLLSLRKIAETEGAVRLKVIVKKKKLYLPTITPVYRAPQKTIFGYLWTAVDLEPLSGTVSKISHRRFKREDRVWVFDQTFRVIAHKDFAQRGKSIKSDVLVKDFGLSGAQPRVDLGYSADYRRGGQRLLGNIVPMTSLGWTVVVEQPRDRAYAAVRTIWITAIAVGLGAAALAIILGLLLSGRLARPVTSVARAAKEVAGGNFDVRVDVKSKDEVGEMAGAFNTMATDLRSYRDELVQQTRIRADLSRYISPDLVEKVVNDEEPMKLGGERREVSVLFADVVAFTPLAEKHPPEAVVAILNELFTFLTEIVFKHGGTVDKFIGDCVMAVFGAPTAQDDHGLRAVRAAEEMLRWLDVGNAKWRKDLGQELELAIGINSGEAVAGNLGSEKRMEYTVVGDTVNIAARLESLARPGQILITEATQALLDDEIDCNDLGEHDIVGRKKQLKILEVVT